MAYFYHPNSKNNHGYSQVLQNFNEDIESGELSVAQYNFVPERLSPVSGLNYVIGIDGHTSVIPHKRLARPTTFLGALLCPCFSTEEPLSDDSRYRFRGCLASLSFVIALVQFILMLVTLKDGFAPMLENPSFGPGTSTLVSFGAKSVHLILKERQVWRLFTSTFLYAGIMHAVVSIIIQLRLGMYLERQWGWPWFLLTFVISGFGGNLLSCVLEPHAAGVGAAGAVAGLVLAYGIQVLLCYRVIDSLQRKLQAFHFIFFFGLILVLLLCPYVNWSNVVGGASAGFFMGIIIWAAEERHAVWVVPAFILSGGFTGCLCYLFLVMQ